jgi:signal peptidase I
MTVPHPQTEDQPPQSNRAGADVSVVAAAGAWESGAVTPPTNATYAIPTTNVTTPASARASRRNRGSDYRLRGLDFNAPNFVRSRPRAVRKHHPSMRRKRRRLLTQWAIVLAAATLVVVLLRVFVVQPYAVRSASMVPTLQPGTNVLVVKSPRLTGPVKVGDVVAYHEPEPSKCRVGTDAHDLVGRVIGLPDETIWSVGQSIYINGQRLNEPGWYNPPFGELGRTPITRTTIPQGSYFVMGDNRTASCDSRSFGPVPKSRIVGKVVATISRGGHPDVHSI